MAKNDNAIEPAFAWAASFSVGIFVMLVLAVGQQGRHVHAGLDKALLALSGVQFLLATGITGAMAEPLPRKPQGGRTPLRLRVSWGILGLCPPPGRSARLFLAALACLIYLYPPETAGLPALLVASAVLLPAAFMRKPESVLRMDAAEFCFFLGTGLLAFCAMFMLYDEAAGPAWQGAVILAVLSALQGQRAREVTALRWAKLLPGVPPPPALDLSRYEVKAAAKPSAGRRALPEGVEAQLVDTGSFRVDAAKMLDKLRQYQLSDPRDFLSAWLRCAAASGAEQIALSRSWNALELRFDGRAFSAAELSQPYQVLVDGGGEDGVRGRHFAYGLLGLYRLKPRLVTVTSRGKDGVAAMRAGRAGPAADPADAPPGTVVRVEWPAWAAWWRPALLTARARGRYGLGPAALTVDGRPVPDLPGNHPYWRPFKKSGWRGATKPSLGAGRVRLYLLGTLIEEVDGAARVDACLTHDGLELDISQSAVVRGRRLEEGLRILAFEEV